MSTENVGDKPRGAVFSAYVSISRRGRTGEPEDKREILFILTERFTQVILTFFEIGNQCFATRLHVKDCREIFNLFIEQGHIPQLLAAAVHITCGFFGRTHPRR